MIKIKLIAIIAVVLVSILGVLLLNRSDEKTKEALENKQFEYGKCILFDSESLCQKKFDYYPNKNK